MINHKDINPKTSIYVTRETFNEEILKMNDEFEDVVQSLQSQIDELKYRINMTPKMVIDPSNSTLTLYGVDGVTPLHVYHLQG